MKVVFWNHTYTCYAMQHTPHGWVMGVLSHSLLSLPVCNVEIKPTCSLICLPPLSIRFQPPHTASAWPGLEVLSNWALASCKDLPFLPLNLGPLHLLFGGIIYGVWTLHVLIFEMWIPKIWWFSLTYWGFSSPLPLCLCFAWMFFII